MNIGQGVDSLSPSNRSKYERTLFKTFLSILYSAAALIFLAFTSAAGGQSVFNHHRSQITGLPSFIKDSIMSLSSGYGFATFCYFVSFVLCLAAAIQISPLICGTAKERLILSKPATFENEP